MIKEISNSYIKLRVDTLGAQIKSLVMNDYEYMWQADSKYWGKTAPNLFPFIARLYGGRYQYRGKEYEMGSHGFIKLYDFRVSNEGKDFLELSLDSNKETYAIYPFSFNIKFKYKLIDNKVEIRTTVLNKGENAMHFSLGAHPGFNTPIDKVGFNDYYLEFSEDCKPIKELISPSLFMANENEEIELENNRIYNLTHDIFNKEDTIIIKDMAKGVTLASHSSKRRVSLEYPDMKYLGIWQSPNKKSPYLCIEPWSSIPGSDNTIMDIEKSDNYIHLNSNSEYINTWSIKVE